MAKEIRTPFGAGIKNKVAKILRKEVAVLESLSNDRELSEDELKRLDLLVNVNKKLETGPIPKPKKSQEEKLNAADTKRLIEAMQKGNKE